MFTIEQRVGDMVVWISHRGIRETGFTENTRAAFDLAVERNFDWLETDLRLTKDQHVVLTHDIDFLRISGNPAKISELTRAQVETLRLPCGNPVMFLDEFMTCYPDHDWVFDVKIETAMGCLQKLNSMLDGFSDRSVMESKITFLLWSLEADQWARPRFPKSRFFARDTECWAAGLSSLVSAGHYCTAQKGVIYAVPPGLGVLNLFTQRNFGAYHKRGAQVLAYLPSSHEELNDALSSGADFVLSDGLIAKQAK